MYKQTPQHKRPKHKIPAGADNFLSVLKGIEGGFAIFTGIIAGLSFTVTNHKLLLVTAAISSIISGFNSSTVRYSSQHYFDELDGREKRRKLHYYFVPAAVEFLVYLLVCFTVLLPLLLISSTVTAIGLCVLLTLLVLFTAGLYRGRLLKTHPLKDALELSVIGALIIAVGALSGYGLSHI